ncbi:MAG: alpha-galactosidase [Armatimonadota bacterium]|nr:MAG: alpha-galactosidase [Armatimonadota bacterium]
MRLLYGTAGVLLAMMTPHLANAIPPAPNEMADARRWAAAGFDGEKPQPPFSFTYDGRRSSEFLQTWQLQSSRRSLDARRTEHRLIYADPASGLVVRCTAIEYRDFPAVEWMLQFHNGGRDNTAILEDIQALDARIAAPKQRPVTLHRSLGDSNSAESFAPVEDIIAPGRQITLAPNGGRSSDGQLPFFNLARRGAGMVMAVGWSGQWEAAFERDGDTVRVRSGMQNTHLRLYPGETIRTPRIVVLLWRGDEALRGNNLFRQLLMSHYLPRRDGELVLPPICGSVGEVEPDGSYEGPHIRVMPILASRGIEVFWSDMDPQQWYPKGFPEGTGTWEPDPVKYPRGMKPVGDAAHAAGLGYLLWFEPERVHFDTFIDREHPEWVMKPDGEWSQLFGLHDPGARKWLTDYIDAQISAAQLDWIRWDFNIEPLGFWRRNDAPDRQGMTEIRHIEGLYAMWDELRARHPGLVVDICASGGRRIDLETLTRGLPLWHSDLQCSGAHPAADQLQNGGLNRWVPLHGCGNFGYEPSYVFRSAMTAGNILATNTSAPESAEAVKRTVALYRKVRPYMSGDFYPLFPHSASEDTWYGYQFHRADLDAGMVLVFRREESPDAKQTVRLRGLKPELRYEVTCEDAEVRRTAKGRNLSALSVEIPAAPESALLFYRKVK